MAEISILLRAASKRGFYMRAIFIGLILLIGKGTVPLDAQPVSHQQPCCPFCNAEVLKSQAFYEDDLVYALYTHKPMCEGHCLIIPKRHVERFEMLSEEEFAHMGKTIQKVHRAVRSVFNTPASYLLLQKNGREAGQSVPHVHIHYIPRKSDSGLNFIFQMYRANYCKPLNLETLQKIIQPLKEAVQ